MPLKEGLFYAGTDDGLIQVTEDGGKNWQHIEVGDLPGVPKTAFVNDIKADLAESSGLRDFESLLLYLSITQIFAKQFFKLP